MLHYRPTYIVQDGDTFVRLHASDTLAITAFHLQLGGRPWCTICNLFIIITILLYWLMSSVRIGVYHISLCLDKK